MTTRPLNVPDSTVPPRWLRRAFLVGSSAMARFNSFVGPRQRSRQRTPSLSARGRALFADTRKVAEYIPGHPRMPRRPSAIRVGSRRSLSRNGTTRSTQRSLPTPVRRSPSSGAFAGPSSVSEDCSHLNVFTTGTSGKRRSWCGSTAAEMLTVSPTTTTVASPRVDQTAATR